MVKKKYEWMNGEVLHDHSRRKHKIIREYFADYLRVRCQLPHREKFRLAIVDGFAGGGRYACGAPGSPVIFVEVLEQVSESLNIERAARNMKPIEIECLLILNDYERDAIELLKSRIIPLEVKIKDSSPRLHLQVEYLSKAFEIAYPTIKQLLNQVATRACCSIWTRLAIAT